MRCVRQWAMAVTAATGLAGFAWAQQPPPVPVQIQSARTVFLANGGNTCSWFIGANRGYRQLYAALRAWGRYQLVATPAQANLILAVSFACPESDPEDQIAYARLRLRIFQPQPQVLLWTVTEPVRSALLQRNRDRNFDAAVRAMVADLQRLGANLPVEEQPPKLQPNWLPIAVAAAVGVVLTVVLLIARHGMRPPAMSPPPPLPLPPPGF